MRITIIFATAFLIAVLVTTVYAADCKGVITVNNIEKRSRPSKDSSVTSKLRRNQQITIGEVKKDNDQRLWYRVGYSGYVEGAYVLITQENGRSWCKLGQAPLNPTTERPTPEQLERQRQQAVAVLRWFSGLFSPQRG